MNRFKKLLGLAAIGTVIASGALVGSAGSAQAANLGTMTVSPGSGGATVPINATTSAGTCPTGSVGTLLELAGPGLSQPNNLMMGFTDIGVTRQGDHYFLPATVTFFDIFQANGVNSPSGTYTLRMICVADDFFTQTDTFETTLTFTPTATAFSPTWVWNAPASGTSTVLTGPAGGTSNFGQSVTFTAAITPPGATGSVQFKDGGANLGSAQAVTAGSASFTTSSLGVGPHSITADYIPTGSFTASTSNTVSHTVNAVATGLTLTSNGPTTQFSPAIFTATISPATAGTVAFKEGAATLGTSPTNGAGVATLSTTTLSVGAHSVTAEFTPSGPGSSPATAGPVTHNVTAFTGVSLTQNVMVTVPTGALTMVLDDGADGVVDLGEAVMAPSGDILTAGADMDVVKITDTRAGDPGWTASGIITDFTKGADAINGFNTGWTPKVISLAANQNAAFVLGSQVIGATEATASSVPSNPALGLETSRTLGTAPDNSGNGTAKLGARLDLNIPTDAPAGVYNALLTLTVI